MSELLDKIDKLLIGDESGATMTGNVANNTAKGYIDVVGMSKRKIKRKKLGEEEADDCPEGQKW